ncbi:dihydrouridine synthase domain-containing protein, putative [Eimeria tenella]|uniref:Dihydrouridine synthase domain-containing protein, putative n=1 Tax=Eimeria tenella TaxID=5802 RepID=U6KLR0_EIMTE|nr:dihydrouridine synthase domain-containing protein, putative [Eimeria tenella]CDJ37232.1 dihydrouridine synthase domain-containing protein, putative [Eimeria tenella]|eukprot:XP_013228070.1 dihydrouridine synthase domain-containing protein, putative [Eimeria tenella]
MSAPATEGTVLHDSKSDHRDKPDQPYESSNTDDLAVKPPMQHLYVGQINKCPSPEPPDVTRTDLVKGPTDGTNIAAIASSSTLGQNQQKRCAPELTSSAEGGTSGAANGIYVASKLKHQVDSSSNSLQRHSKRSRTTEESSCEGAPIPETEDSTETSHHLHSTKAGILPEVPHEESERQSENERQSAQAGTQEMLNNDNLAEKYTSASVHALGLYNSSWILAPMVRISTLPFRLECLKYGADVVYTEEIVDRKLLDTKRHINKDFGTIEYISKSDRRCIFSTCELEKGKVILQLGTADATRALQAATVAIQDVAAVDINMGCPKSFSVKGGMGAALLQTPDLAMDILKTLVRNVPCPVTCKIRLLETMEETVDFARKCESTGIAAIAVHARLLRSALKIPLIANGDFLSAEDATRFQDSYHIGNLMFARGAMWDPSLFAQKKVVTTEGTAACSFERTAVLQDYIKRAVLCGSPYQSIKFTLQEMTARDSDKKLKLDLVAANSTAKLCDVFGLGDFYKSIEHVPYANTLNYYKHIDIG